MRDIESFQEQLRCNPALHAFLAASNATGSVIFTRAPGRLDVMGGVADYSGALVAQATIGEAAIVGLTKRSDRRLSLWSLGIEREGFTPKVEVDLDSFSQGDVLINYANLRAQLTGDRGTRWAAYIAGCFYVLLAEGIVKNFSQGANILLDSRVPLGAGVSSSAAIEVATMQAINVAYELNMDGVTLARLAQMVENRVVGAPCGIMDQMASTLGVENGLLLLLCQPHDVKGTQALPPGVRVYGINSNLKHSVGGAAYTRARVGAFMGRKLLVVPYVTDITPKRFHTELAATLPAKITGGDFLKAYGETGDTVTRIDPSTVYAVRAATAHAIYEHDRVSRFVALLHNPKDLAGALVKAGKLMYGSHWSYGRIGLGSRETDLLSRLGRARGPKEGIYGAKISGGGSGGTVAFLTYGESSERVIQEIASEYEAATGNEPNVFVGGQSPGAMEFGHREIKLPSA